MPFRLRLHAVRLASILAALVVCGAATHVSAQELLEPRVKDRKYPAGTWCPIDLDLRFTANGPTAMIKFSTEVFFRDPNQSDDTTFCEQFLDNICVVPESLYDAVLVDAPAQFDGSGSCYLSPGGTYVPKRFPVHDVGDIPLKERFGSDPAKHWDMGHGAWWNTLRTATNNPGPVEDDFDSTGCLGMGRREDYPAEPSLQDSATTSITVSGLERDRRYVLTGWWYAGVMNVNSDPDENVSMTIRITGSNATPIVRRTWGALKSQYRR